MLRILKDTAARLGDKITEVTGWTAVRVPLPAASRERQVTLDLPGYCQMNSYCCGAVSGAMVARFFHPELAFGTIYEAIAPDPDLGTSTTRLTGGLRACGVCIARSRHLKFRDLCAAIDQGSPVVVSIHYPDCINHHWIVVYGYGKRPDQVFIAGNFPWTARNPLTRRQFEAVWQPKGNGLICSSKELHRRRCRKRTSVSRQ